MILFLLLIVKLNEANQTIEVISEVIEDLCYDIGGNIIGKECKFVVECFDDIIIGLHMILLQMVFVKNYIYVIIK